MTPAAVPFMDLAAQDAPLRAEILARLEAVMTRAAFILGPEVAEFERAFADYCGAAHGVGVASGLDALKLALRAAGVGPGDEVITAANTFIATALAISATGATPVLVEPDPRTCNLDPARAAAAVTPRTRAIVPVHLYGRPADMSAIMALAAQHGLFVLEDASQAHGARWNGRPVGGIGHAAAFSFYPGKNLGAHGDAGMVVTNDAALAARVASLRNYGSSEKYRHDDRGENSRLDTVQAAVLLTKLPRLDGWNAHRRAAAARYTAALAGVGDLCLPTDAAGQSVYHLYVIRTGRRDDLMAFLRARGIGCLIHYPVPIHLQNAYRDAGWRAGDFPVTEQIAREILSLPMSGIISDLQVDTVADAIRTFFA